MSQMALDGAFGDGHFSEQNRSSAAIMLPCVLDELSMDDVRLVECGGSEVSARDEFVFGGSDSDAGDSRLRAMTRANEPAIDLGLPDVLDDLDKIRHSTMERQRRQQLQHQQQEQQEQQEPGQQQQELLQSEGPTDGPSEHREGDSRVQSQPSAIADGARTGSPGLVVENSLQRPSSTSVVENKTSSENAGRPVWRAVRPTQNATMARKAQAESLQLRLFRVFMPEQQGYVTLPFKPEMTLEQVRSAIMRKRAIRLTSGQVFAFQRTHETIGGERTLVIPLTLKDFTPPSSDKEIPLFYNLSMLAREGHGEVAMFVRPGADPSEIERTVSRFY